MDNKKESLILYYDTLEIVEDLSDEQAGKLFKAITAFEINGEVPDFRGEMKMLWLPFKNALIRARKKYEAVCAKNRLNILKRWAKKHGKTLPPKHPFLLDTDVYDGIRPYTNVTKHTERDPEPQRDSDPERSVSLSEPEKKFEEKNDLEIAKEVFG